MAKLKEPEAMEDCAYFSRRSLEDGHKLVLWVPKDAPTVMNVNFECSKCKHEDSFTEEFKLPLRMRVLFRPAYSLKQAANERVKRVREEKANI